jgi:mannose-6-phosphate isomerase-like protein (cupin superfamily)
MIKRFDEFLNEEKSTAEFWLDNIDKATIENENYRKVLFTGTQSQLVLMNIKPGTEIGSEVHEKGDQFLRVEKGSGKAVLNGKKMEFKTNDAVVIPAGTEHNIINDGEEDLKLYVIYSPAEHPDGLIQSEKI